MTDVFKTSREDRRIDARYPVLVPGEVDTLAGPVPIQAVNLGAKGVGVNVDSPLLVGSTVRLRLIRNPGDDDPIVVLGEVKWCTEHVEVGFHAGILITNMDPQVETRWRAWLMRLEETD